MFSVDACSVFHDLIQVVRGDAKPIGIAPDGMILLEGMVYSLDKSVYIDAFRSGVCVWW